MKLKVIAGIIVILAASVSAEIPAGYAGQPYEAVIQEVAGRILLYRFDVGAEDVSWHDWEESNPWYCKLRSETGVGLQLMGAGGDRMDAPYPGIELVNNDCYLANTNTGDWTKYTVDVKESGLYSISGLTAASETDIPFIGVSFLDGADSVSTGTITLPITSYFHAWVYTPELATIQLNAGLQVMRFDIVGNGPMNINYLDFELIDGTQVEPVSANVFGFISHSVSGSGLSITFGLEEAAPVRLELFDMAGRLVQSAQSVLADKGANTVKMGSVRSGLYFVKLLQGENVNVRKVMISR